MGSPHPSSTAYIRGIGACLQLSIAVDAFLFDKLSTLFCLVIILICLLMLGDQLSPAIANLQRLRVTFTATFATRS